MSEINVFGCTSCNTLWDDVDLGDDGRCAACWRAEAERLRAADEYHRSTIGKCNAHIQEQEAEIERLRAELAWQKSLLKKRKITRLALRLTHLATHQLTGYGKWSRQGEKAR